MTSPIRRTACCRTASSWRWSRGTDCARVRTWISPSRTTSRRSTASRPRRAGTTWARRPSPGARSDGEEEAAPGTAGGTHRSQRPAGRRAAARRRQRRPAGTEGGGAPVPGGGAPPRPPVVGAPAHRGLDRHRGGGGRGHHPLPERLRSERDPADGRASGHGGRVHRGGAARRERALTLTAWNRRQSCPTGDDLTPERAATIVNGFVYAFECTSNAPEGSNDPC